MTHVILKVLRPVSYVPDDDSFSDLSILYYPLQFLWIVYFVLSLRILYRLYSTSSAFSILTT